MHESDVGYDWLYEILDEMTRTTGELNHIWALHMKRRHHKFTDNDGYSE